MAVMICALSVATRLPCPGFFTEAELNMTFRWMHVATLAMALSIVTRCTERASGAKARYQHSIEHRFGAIPKWQ